MRHTAGLVEYLDVVEDSESIPDDLELVQAVLDAPRLGLWPTCPCWEDADGARRAASFGHHVGNGGLYVWPGEAALVVQFDDGDPLAIERSLELGEVLRPVLDRARNAR